MSWKDAPKPIDPEDVTQIVDADFVVVGVGVAGSIAATKATELGLKTVAIDSRSIMSRGPHWIGAFNSRKMREAGIIHDRAKVVNDLMWHANYCADQRLIQLWFDRSGEMMDWYTDLVESTGELVVAIETAQKDTGGLHMSPATGHVPCLAPFVTMGPNETGLWRASNILLDHAVELGLDLRWNTRAVQLLQDEAARICGVIAQDADGKHLRINASKGVILCTGGYIANAEMRHDLNPIQDASTTALRGATDRHVGDGIKMATWVGADMSELHWWMDNDRGLPDGSNFTPGSQPWLRTDCYGNRFCNEDVPYDYGAYVGSLLPSHRFWEIFDSDYWAQMRSFETTICSRAYPKAGAINSEKVAQSAEEFYHRFMEPVLKKGYMVQAQSIEELAEAMLKVDDRMNAATLTKTVERYNELAHKGVDEDFGKLPRRLLPLEKPPYYAVWVGGSAICNLDGLRINERIQVLNTEGVPIEGLYAAGNDAGGYFGMSYPWYYAGCACGFATTFAYLAAIDAASR